MTRALGPRVLLVLLAGGLSLGACGGDDEPSEAEQIEAFCAATGPLEQLSAGLAEVQTNPAIDLAEAQSKVLGFLDKLDTMLELAPGEIDSEANQVRPLIDPVRERVTVATSVNEIQAEIPQLITSLAADAEIDNSVLEPIYLFVIENCPS